jgi:transaldolase
MKPLAEWKVKIFADGANRDEILALYRNPLIKGFTTNPTLMRKAGVANYEEFARNILAEITDRPISLEVFADDFAEMERQARKISAWGKNVYVKVPVTNTKAESALPLIRRLSGAGIKLNVTAMTTFEQVKQVVPALAEGPAAFASVFAGRVADTGIDPVPVMAEIAALLRREAPRVELIWSSPREVLNVVQAESVGCHIITATSDILKKLELLGRDLTEYSLDTVKMFYRDAAQAGFEL